MLRRAAPFRARRVLAIQGRMARIMGMRRCRPRARAASARFQRLRVGNCDNGHLGQRLGLIDFLTWVCASGFGPLRRMIQRYNAGLYVSNRLVAAQVPLRGCARPSINHIVPLGVVRRQLEVVSGRYADNLSLYFMFVALSEGCSTTKTITGYPMKICPDFLGNGRRARRSQWSLSR